MSKPYISESVKRLDGALDKLDEAFTAGLTLLQKMAETIRDAHEQEGEAADAMAESLPSENNDEEIACEVPIPLEPGRLVYSLEQFPDASPFELRHIVEVEKQLAYIRQRAKLLGDLKDVMDARKHFQRDIDRAIAGLDAETKRMIKIN